MTSIFRHLITAALAISLSSFTGAAAFASGRVALVIGNGAYRHVDPLVNPPNDAADVAAALKRLGFDTILATDQDKAGMEEAEIRFARAASNADVAMFYYSGHALQFAGINYLAPVDAQLTDTADLRRMVRVDDLVADLQRAKNLRILVLDSCRNNPLAEQLNRLLVATRGIQLERGLAKMDTPEGMIVAYSTQAGHVAYDGDQKESRNSPYTKAFLKEIEARDEIGTIFRQVSADVYDATGKQQLPELSLSFIGKFYLNGTPELAPKPEDTAPRDFEAARSLDTLGGWDAFLKQHPEGYYASLAKEWRAKAEAKLAAALPAAPAALPPLAVRPAPGVTPPSGWETQEKVATNTSGDTPTDPPPQPKIDDAMSPKLVPSVRYVAVSISRWKELSTKRREKSKTISFMYSTNTSLTICNSTRSDKIRVAIASRHDGSSASDNNSSFDVQAWETIDERVCKDFGGIDSSYLRIEAPSTGLVAAPMPGAETTSFCVGGNGSQVPSEFCHDNAARLEFWKLPGGRSTVVFTNEKVSILDR
jgi:caspase domain-containing protein